jgi:flagellar biosynthetic protein FliR
MELFITEFHKFFLILSRISGIFVATPFFANINIPMRARAALSLLISLAVFPSLINTIKVGMPTDMVAYGWLMVREILIGIAIGFAGTIMFTAFQLSGQFYSLQMGLGIINVMDPLSEIQMPIIGQMLSSFGFLIFLLVGGHHLVIRAVYKSFELVPTLSIPSLAPLADGLMDIFANMFKIAFMMGAPIIGVVFLCSVAMGLLARAAPQMNVMMLGWPLKIFVGVSTLILIIPMLFGKGWDVFVWLYDRIDEILYEMGRLV